MKKYLLLLALLPLAALSVHAQKLAEKQVPAAAVATFKKAHPTAKGVKWEKEDANYEAGYEQGDKELSVVITPTGTLLETETELAVSQLPAPVRTALTTQYKGYKVTEAAKIVTATGTTIYEAEVSRAGKKRDVLFNADGTEVKK
ncbi:PepSY-like domain-containing protein [Hymenobacter lucidus]|uniref:PepSY-like domain-containing protein n=1 Tax=Hymenobacter lucidus TaxID=2880930 RepID=A0ABS8AY61_9BACT|nr:PepSY-like domain-containing protein [Hymenobacter lucidus]MCB2410713.1 PepSY-like domain-containing protein [Hymenobacter lucidus]